MHEGVSLSILGLAFALTVEYGPILAALAVTIDAIRRRPVDFEGRIPGGRWIWIAPNLAFLAVIVLGYAGVSHPVLGYAVVGLYLTVVFLDFAYLLRVVFPSPARRAARELATTIGRTPEE